MQKTSFLALLGKNFPEKLSGFSAKEKKPSFFHTDFPLRGRGGGDTPLTDKIR